MAMRVETNPLGTAYAVLLEYTNHYSLSYSGMQEWVRES
jgi:hypothetical protein